MFVSDKTRNVHIVSMEVLPQACDVFARLPTTEPMRAHIARSRQLASNCLHGRDKRLLLHTGPCSVHDIEGLLEFARRIKALQPRLKNVVLFLRGFFEKPRSAVDWEGFLNDPYLDGSCRIGDGIFLARGLLLELARMEIPVATEFVDPSLINFFADLISWGAIGARSTEGPLHFRPASGLSMTMGVKNTTSGAIEPAINTIAKVRYPRTFVGPNDEGKLCSITTTGNPDAHLILRGGSSGPNYDVASVEQASELLQKKCLPARLGVDFSHAQSGKDFRQQIVVAREVARQRKAGGSPIFCAMQEGNLVEGRQDIGPLDTLTFGKSITDGCAGWEETEETILLLDRAG